MGLELATQEQMVKWPKPNYVNPESRKGMLYGFEIPLIVITSIAMGLRMYTRAFLTRSIGTDDWLMLCATIVGVALAIVNCMSCNYGLGLHVWDWSIERILTDLAPFRKLALSTELLFVASIYLSKTSILVFYLRIFSDKKFRALVYAGLVYTALWGIITFCLGLFQCTPIKSYWDYSIKGHCLPSLPTILTTAVLNTASDFYVFVLPLPRVWEIQLPKKQRIGLMMVMALGLLSCIAGCVRIYYTKVIFHDSPDFTFEAVPMYVSTALETNISIICACLPAAKPLFARMFPRLLGGSSLHSHSLSASAVNFSRKGAPGGTGNRNTRVYVSYSDKSKPKSSRSRRSGTFRLSSFAGDEVDSPTYYNKNNYYHEMKGYSIGHATVNEFKVGNSSNSSEENIAPDTTRHGSASAGDEGQGFTGIKRQVEIEVRYSEADLGRPDAPQLVDVPLPRRPSRTATTMLSRSPEDEEMRRPRRI